MSKEEDMQRTLVAEFGPLSFNTDRDGNVTTVLQGGYTNLSTTGVALFFEETIIDLSGYALKKKTFYPFTSFEQRSGPTAGSFGDEAAARLIYDTIIVSSIPLTKEEVSFGYTASNLPGFSGFPLGDAYRINRDPLMHQHQTIYSHDSTTAGTAGTSIYRIASKVNGSSLEPTASDKLYCYRLITSVSSDGGALLPAARIIIPGSISSEPKIEYMMRLKRSYELANQV